MTVVVHEPSADLSAASRLVVPAVEETPWPSLGFEVIDWIEAHLVHGPGDKLGDAATLTEEMQLFLLRAYEVYPRGHEHEGRRRFKRCALSRRKGSAKTELAAWIAIAEMDPTAPVRCDGWRQEAGEWLPVGRPVRDPYIPMVSTTEEQTEELAYGAVVEILKRCPLGNEYDIGLSRIMHGTYPGKMVALASSPSAREGARTTFQHFDETYLFIADRLVRAHGTMLRNIPKRRAADPWSLETSTTYEPAAGSVAEATHRYALDVLEGRTADARLLFDHRQASDGWDLDDPAELLEAITEASGDAIAWADVDGIASLYRDPQMPVPDFRRFFLNQCVKGADRWIDPIVWASRAVPSRGRPLDGNRIVLMFDGSYSRDSTGLVGCTVEETPHLFVVDAWERPSDDPGWRVPVLDVKAAVEDAMERWDVAELAVDPPGWRAEVEEWEQTYDVTERFETNQPSRMGPAADEFTQALAEASFTQDGSFELSRHIGNCVPVLRRGHLVPTKSHPDSPDKIDLAVAAVVAYHRARWHFVNAVPVKRPAVVWG